MQFARFRYVAVTLTLLAVLALVRGSGPTTGNAATAADHNAATLTPTGAGSAEGHWEGAIDVTGQTIPVRVTLKSTDGVLKGTVDFPTQNVLSLPLDRVSLQGSRLHFEAVPAPNTAVFDGSLQDETMSGVFQQVGITGTFQLQRAQPAADAPLPYKAENDVAFIILMSGPGLPGKDVIVEQMRMIAEANGVSETQIEENAALAERIMDAVITGQGWDAVKADLRRQALDTAAAAMPESQRQSLGDINQWADKGVETQVQVWTSPWIMFFLTYDPALALQIVTVPVLALFGGLDAQVPAASNEAAIMAALDKGGNKDHTAKVFPDADHLYQSAKTGSPNEYAQRKPEFTAGFLETIGAWILTHARLADG